MRYCTKCGLAVPDNAQHCPHCGQNLDKKNIPTAAFYVAGITFLTIAVILFVGRIQPNPGTPQPIKNITFTAMFQSMTLQPTRTKRITTPTVAPTIVSAFSSTEATPPGSCPGAPNPRIFINALVRVVTTDNDRLVLRSSPTIRDSTELQRLNTGTQLKIHDGPVCVNDASTGINYWFWEVKVKSSGRMGWVAEGDRSLYYLQLVK